jgi:hypothetical protein
MFHPLSGRKVQASPLHCPFDCAQGMVQGRLPPGSVGDRPEHFSDKLLAGTAVQPQRATDRNHEKDAGVGQVEIAYHFFSHLNGVL